MADRSVKAGTLDRRIDIQRKTVFQEESGQQVETWENLATRFAAVMPVRGDERFTADQFVAREQVEFRIRYAPNIADINPLDRIIYPPAASAKRQIYDIIAVNEIGRREGFKIIAARRPEKTVEVIPPIIPTPVAALLSAPGDSTPSFSVEFEEYEAGNTLQGFLDGSFTPFFSHTITAQEVLDQVIDLNLPPLSAGDYSIRFRVTVSLGTSPFSNSVEFSV